jgi:hypothetical protein
VVDKALKLGIANKTRAIVDAAAAAITTADEVISIIDLNIIITLIKAQVVRTTILEAAEMAVREIPGPLPTRACLYTRSLLARVRVQSAIACKTAWEAKTTKTAIRHPVRRGEEARNVALTPTTNSRTTRRLRPKNLR